MKKKIVLLFLLMQITTIVKANGLLDGNHQKGGTTEKEPDSATKKYVDDKISGAIKEIDDEIEETSKELKSTLENYNNDFKIKGIYDGTSAAMAMSNLGVVNSGFKYNNQINIAYGYYSENHAVALGYSGISPDDRFTYRIATSITTKGHFGIGMGLGVMFGKFKNNSNEKMQKEIDDLKEQIKQLKELINKSR